MWRSLTKMDGHIKSSNRVPRDIKLTKRIIACFKNEGSIEGKEIRITLVLAISFQLIFTAHFAIQNLQSSLHHEDARGAIALGSLYACSILSSIFSPTIIGIIGIKACLWINWTAHIIYTLAQSYSFWGTLIPVSVIVGITSGPIWTAQGLYVSACGYSYSSRSLYSPYTILSRFNGLFFMLYETRHIVGNIISSVVLHQRVGKSNNDVTFEICGAMDCPANDNATNIPEPDAHLVNTLLFIYLGMQLLALLLTVLFVLPLPGREWSTHADVHVTVVSWFKVLVSTKIIFLVPFMISQTMQHGFLLSEYTKSYITCALGIHVIGFVMTGYGAAAALLVLIVSRLARHTGYNILFALAAATSFVQLVVLYRWTPTKNDRLLIYLFPLSWGIGEAVWETQINSLIAIQFWKNKESAFANYQTWRAVGFTIIYTFHGVLCVKTKITIIIAFLVLGMFCYFGAELHTRCYRRWLFDSNTGTCNISGPEHISTMDNVETISSVLRNKPLPHLTTNVLQSNVSSLSSCDRKCARWLCNCPHMGDNKYSCASKPSAYTNAAFMFGESEERDCFSIDKVVLENGKLCLQDNYLKEFGVNLADGTQSVTHSPRMLQLRKCDCKIRRNRSEEECQEDVDISPSRRHSNSACDWHWPFKDQGELQFRKTRNYVFVF